MVNTIVCSCTGVHCFMLMQQFAHYGELHTICTLWCTAPATQVNDGLHCTSKHPIFWPSKQFFNEYFQRYWSTHGSKLSPEEQQCDIVSHELECYFYKLFSSHKVKTYDKCDAVNDNWRDEFWSAFPEWVCHLRVQKCHQIGEEEENNFMIKWPN